jgi:hypothetical protein
MPQKIRDLLEKAAKIKNRVTPEYSEHTIKKVYPTIT